MKDLLLRLIANGAGVVQDQAAVILVLHPRVALLLQRPDDFFRVMGVHLAAEGLDIESLTHTYSIAVRQVSTDKGLAGRRLHAGSKNRLPTVKRLAALKRQWAPRRVPISPLRMDQWNQFSLHFLQLSLC